jgi:LacI family transcriptional regulator, repressor for deo operon, udp, cdd, tsx, nupC, and nupG
MEPLQQITIDSSSGTDLAQQLKQQLAWLIATSQLQPGQLLPSIRVLSRHLSINLHTVRSAYQKLEADGLVQTRHGLGTVVTAYDPVLMAHLAAAQRTHTVGVLIPSINNPFYQPFIQGIEAVASRNRTMLFLCMTKDDPGETIRYYNQLAARHVDGLILASQESSIFLPTDPEQLEQSLLAFPVVSADWPGSLGYSVELDLEGSGYLATRHLLEHGHRRVGMITVAGNIPNIDPIHTGYRKALREAGLESDPQLVFGVQGFDLADGEAGARRLLALETPPSAIFAIADLLALGALRHLKRAGLRVPQDMALAGFNDIPMADMVDPPLTTVAAPAYQMGQEAMKMLEELMAGKPPQRRRVLLPASLVIRASCGEHPNHRK